MNLPIVGKSSNRSPLENNRSTNVSRVTRTVPTEKGSDVVDNKDASASIESQGQKPFVERRTSPDRRQKNKTPLVDTRRPGDRRRAKVDVIV